MLDHQRTKGVTTVAMAQLVMARGGLAMVTVGGGTIAHGSGELRMAGLDLVWWDGFSGLRRNSWRPQWDEGVDGGDKLKTGAYLVVFWMCQ